MTRTETAARMLADDQASRARCRLQAPSPRDLLATKCRLITTYLLGEGIQPLQSNKQA